MLYCHLIEPNISIIHAFYFNILAFASGMLQPLCPGRLCRADVTTATSASLAIAPQLVSAAPLTRIM